MPDGGGACGGCCGRDGWPSDAGAPFSGAAEAGVAKGNASFLLRSTQTIIESWNVAAATDEDCLPAGQICCFQMFPTTFVLAI